MVGGGKARETHLPLPQAHGRRDAAESLVQPGDYSGQATANRWWWGLRAARHATGWRQEVAGRCWEGARPASAAKPAMNASAREQRGRSRGQPSRGCHGAALLPVDMGWVLLHKSLVLFCTGPSISTVNVLTAPRLLGQSLPRFARSKGLPTVRLVVHGNMLLVSPLLLSCPLHAGCLQKEMCSTELFTASVPAKHWRLPSAVHGVEKG